MIARASLGLTIAALTLCACAGTQGEDLASLGQAVVNGAPDLDDPAVVALLHRLPKDHAPPRMAFCSGVLLAPNVALTAAHCVAEEHDGPFDVFFGSQVAAGGTVIPVEAVLVHPAYDAATHGFDVALLRLAFDSTNAPYRLPSNVAALLAAGASVRAIGFGVDDAQDGFPDSKRSGIMAIAEVDDDTFDTSPGPAMTCTGDSGGPVLATDPGGEERLLGMTVFGDPGCNAHAINQRIDRLGDFIAPFIEPAGAPNAGCSFDRHPPRPTAALVSALAVVVFGVRRHRRMRAARLIGASLPRARRT